MFDITQAACEDIIDVRDIIERFEELEQLQEDGEYTEAPDCELSCLRELLEDLVGRDGDEQWRGDWYPVTLVNESYFAEYSQELLEDCGEIPRDLPSYIVIDWEATADNLKGDYTTIEIDGCTFYCR